jgi:AAA family ATP:ADP antiporter
MVAYSSLDGTALLFIAAGLLTICLPLNRALWNKHIRPLNTFQQKKRLTGFGEHPFWLIRKSKHLSYLALIIGLSVVVSKLVEYQFSSVAAQNFEDPDQLTAFFGFWFSTFNVVSFIVQLFLTRQIVGTFGVGSSLFALPGGVFVGSALLIFAPVLSAAIFVKLWEVSVKQSVNKSATELLALPIPANIKSQTKSFIDVFVDLAATGVAGLLLIFVVNGLDLSVRAISILTIVIVLFWAWVAVKVRREYIKSFKSKLTQADRSAAKDDIDFSSISVLNGLKKAMELGSENQVLYVLEKVRQIPNKKLFDNVLQFLNHDSAKVRVAALKCIYYLEKTVDQETLNTLLIDPDLEVRYRAFTQLLRQTKEGRIAIINQYLTNPDPLISGAALVGLAEEARNNEEMKKLLKVEQKIREKMDYLTLVGDAQEQRQYKIMILRAIGQAKVEALYSEIASYLSDPDPIIINEAIKAAGLTLKEEFIGLITPFLVEKNTRKSAEEALLFYGIGISSVLEKMAFDPSVKTAVISQFPSVIAKLDADEAVKTLFHFLENADNALRLEALRSLNTMQREFPLLKIKKDEVIGYVIDEAELFKNTLGILYKQNQLLPEEESKEVIAARKKLIELLEKRLDSTLERIFRLIGLRYPPDEIMSAYNGIKSRDDHLRLNSVEFLDNLLEPALKKTLVPIAESSFFEKISSETLLQLKVKIPDEKKCLTLLLEGRDVKLKMAVLELVYALNNKEYKPLVEALLKSPQLKIREQAQKVISSMNG